MGELIIDFIEHLSDNTQCIYTIIHNEMYRKIN